MAIGDQKFHIDFYQQYLTEVGFLLSYTQAYFTDPEIPWLEVLELERRIDANVDAFEVGADQAFQCALEFLESDDEDELLGAAYSLAALRPDNDRLNAVLKAFVEAGEDLLPLFVAALGHGGHPAISDALVPLLAHERLLVRAACAEILGYRHDIDPKKIWPYLHNSDTSIRDHTLSIYAALAATEVMPISEELIFGSGDELSHQNLTSLIRLGSKKAVALCRELCSQPETATPELLMRLAIIGENRDGDLFYSATAFPELLVPSIRALAILGDSYAVPALINVLKEVDDAHRVEVAAALELVTGAGLQETVTLPEEEMEELDVDDILGTSSQKSRKSEPPRIVEVTRVSTSIDSWQRWWQHNQNRFAPSTRWRKGHPFSVAMCLNELTDPRSPLTQRRRAYAELQSAGCRIPFEPDWLVSKQFKALRAMQGVSDMA